MKKMRFMIAILAAGCLFSINEKVHAALGNAETIDLNGDEATITFEENEDVLLIQFAADHLVKFDYRPGGRFSEPTPMIDPTFNVNAVPVNVEATETNSELLLQTAEMTVAVQKNPVRIALKDDSGEQLLWEAESGGLFEDGVRFLRDESDPLYGIHGYNAFEGGGNLLRNNNTRRAHAGEQGDVGGPFIWSTAGYSILIDSDGGYPYTEAETGKLEFYFGGTPEEGRRYEKENVEFYLTVGNPETIMESYAEVTGKAPMLPKWSLGFMNFEWGINQEELEQTINTYRAKNIPLDAYALDYDWLRYGEDDYGEFRWNTENFPDADGPTLKNRLEEDGVHLIGIRKPRIAVEDLNGRSTIQGRDAEANDYFYPGHQAYNDYFIPVPVRSIDHYKPSARQWWWENHIDAFDKGIVGWWNDESDKVSSGAAQYWFGNFATAHVSQAMYEGQRDYTNDETRVWQTGRNHYPGTQRFGTTMWSGDIAIQYHKGEKVDWAAGMQEQPVAMLSAVHLGQGKWGMDAGGFNMADGTIDNPSPELYARWIQFGSMTPVFRVHGNNGQKRQPWLFGLTAEEAAKTAMLERSRLTPYMYSYEQQASEGKVGLIRPLLLDYPDDEYVDDYSDGWMFGEYLYVAPVLEEGQTSKLIYLPEGRWIDYARGHIYEGGQTFHYPIDASSWNDLPMFVKEGAIIPTQPPANYVGEHRVDTVTVDIFPSEEQTSFSYYEDDGSSYAYESGEYMKQLLLTEKEQNGSYVTIAEREGDFSQEAETFMIRIHEQAAASVSKDGTPLQRYDTLEELKQAEGEGWTIGATIYGKTTYVKTTAGDREEKTFQLTGSIELNESHFTYQAENGSLSGDSNTTQARISSEHTGFTGEGYVEGLEQDGAGVTFYTNVPVSGQYAVDFIYGNGTSINQDLTLFINGKKIESIQFSPTGSWTNWENESIVLPLSAGQNSITIRNDANSGQVNLDALEIDVEAKTSIYMAESGELTGGAAVNQNHWFYSGTGFVDGFHTSGAKSRFTVDVPRAGTYQLSMRYANGTESTRTLGLEVNEQRVQQLQLPSEGGNWNVWQESLHEVQLEEGRNTIAYTYGSGDSGNVNLDRLLLSEEPITYKESNVLDNASFERNTNVSSNWNEWHPSGQASAFGVDSGSGINPPESPIHGNQRAYFWSNNAYKQSIHQTVSVPDGIYRFDALVRTQNQQPLTARLEATDYGGAPRYEEIPFTGSWQRVTIPEIEIQNGQIKVGFYVDSPGGTTLHIDDVRLVKTN